MPNEINYKIAVSDADFDEGKSIFKEYAASLGVDLCFQDFDTELAHIHEQYNQPGGALLLACDGAEVIGCAGIRKLADKIAELKRMYVKESYRGQKTGLRLLEQSLEIARKLGYRKIRLDTLKEMTRAKELYRSFGFYDITAYCFNPLEGTIYMEKEL